MSFRSRSRTVQPIVTRRATSLTRTAPSLSSTPLSSSSYGRSYGTGSTNPYSSSTSAYSSYSPVSTSSPSARLNLSNGSSSGHYFDYSNLSSRRDSYGSNSSLAYKSPYKDKDRYGNGSSYGSSYKDRYISPYSSSTYDNGASSLSYGLKRANHLSSNGLSNSNSSLNSSYSPSSYVSKAHPGVHVGRSQSLRDHERRSRSRSRASIASNLSSGTISRSYSTNSVQSEGYESGVERGRSRVGSTASDLAADAQKDGAVVESKENGGDYVDYKALYEQAKADNEKLKSSMRKKDEEVISLKSALDRFTTATTKNNSLSELEKRERRAMERKMSEMEEELKLLQKYKTENERLRAENRALTRVVSKLTTSAQNQLHSKQ